MSCRKMEILEETIKDYRKKFSDAGMANMQHDVAKSKINLLNEIQVSQFLREKIEELEGKIEELKNVCDNQLIDNIKLKKENSALKEKVRSRDATISLANDFISQGDISLASARKKNIEFEREIYGLKKQIEIFKAFAKSNNSAAVRFAKENHELKREISKNEEKPVFSQETIHEVRRVRLNQEYKAKVAKAFREIIERVSKRIGYEDIYIINEATIMDFLPDREAINDLSDFQKCCLVDSIVYNINKSLGLKNRGE